MLSKLGGPFLRWWEVGVAEEVGKAAWAEDVAIVGVRRWEDAEKESNVAVEGRCLVAALLIEPTTSRALEGRNTPVQPLGWVELLVVQSKRPLW